MATLLASKLGSGGGNSFGAFNDPAIDAWITAMAADLSAAKGRALVLCGSQQPAAVHQAVTQINQALGAQGSPAPSFPGSRPAALEDLAVALKGGAVKTLLVLGGNPAFDAPADLNFADLLGKVEQVIRLGLRVDETSALSTTHVPAAHFLESWGDAMTHQGDYLSIQPLILPLYDGISELGLLGQLAGMPAPKGPEYVREVFAQVAGTPFPANSGPDFDNAWRQFVHDGHANMVNGMPVFAQTFEVSNPAASGSGYLPKNTETSELSSAVAAENSGIRNVSGQNDTPAPTSQGPGNLAYASFGSTTLPKPLQASEYELVFTLGGVDDGRYANNGWLQELPDPVTKLTWDNALLMSPATATKLGVNVGTVNDSAADLPDTDFSPRSSNNPLAIDPTTAYPMVRVTTPDGRSLELPVLVAPGTHDQTLVLALGYGRTALRLTDAQRKSVTSPLRVADGAGLQRLYAAHLRHARLRHRREGGKNRPHLSAGHDPGA